MKSLLKCSPVILAVSLLVTHIGWAGPQQVPPRPSFIAGGAAPRGWFAGAQPQPYYYPDIYHRWPSYPSVVVISPYGPSYYLPPTVVVTAPFYCAFDNHGFVSRIGLLDHLSGMHKIPLEAAATICPGDTGSCVFPSY
jgi:hypothetical protein